MASHPILTSIDHRHLVSQGKRWGQACRPGQERVKSQAGFPEIQGRALCHCKLTYSLGILLHHPWNLNSHFHLGIFGSQWIVLTYALKKKGNDPVTDLRSTAAVIPILDYSKFLLHQARSLWVFSSSLHHVHRPLGELCLSLPLCSHRGLLQRLGQASDQLESLLSATPLVLPTPGMRPGPHLQLSWGSVSLPGKRIRKHFTLLIINH